ncbi:hypothetical protein MMC17_008340 [Xylographa soralifera]|nr:hypothetical protein [Xylographa soralifera]
MIQTPRVFHLYDSNEWNRMPRGITIGSCSLAIDIASSHRDEAATSWLMLYREMFDLIQSCVVNGHRGLGGTSADEHGFVFTVVSPSAVNVANTCMATYGERRTDISQCVMRAAVQAARLDTPNPWPLGPTVGRQLNLLGPSVVDSARGGPLGGGPAGFGPVSGGLAGAGPGPRGGSPVGLGPVDGSRAGPGPGSRGAGPVSFGPAGGGLAGAGPGPRGGSPVGFGPVDGSRAGPGPGSRGGSPVGFGPVGGGLAGPGPGPGPEGGGPGPRRAGRSPRRAGRGPRGSGPGSRSLYPAGVQPAAAGPAGHSSTGVPMPEADLNYDMMDFGLDLPSVTPNAGAGPSDTGPSAPDPSSAGRPCILPAAPPEIRGPGHKTLVGGQYKDVAGTWILGNDRWISGWRTTEWKSKGGWWLALGQGTPSPYPGAVVPIWRGGGARPIMADFRPFRPDTPLAEAWIAEDGTWEPLQGVVPPAGPWAWKGGWVLLRGETR